MLAANYFMNGMFQDMTLIPMIHMLLFFMAGLTVNAQLMTEKVEQVSDALPAVGAPA